MEAKKQKLQNQFNNSVSDGQISNIFAGISIFVNGYTVPCADELKRLMAVHGGQYHNYYNRLRTTHIIATNLPDTKIKELRGEKIVKPEWITDSIQKGSLLPCQPYQLYIQASRLQPTLNFQRNGESKETKMAVGKEVSEPKERTESKVVDEFQVLETWRSAVKKSPPVTGHRKQVPEVVTKTKESCATTSKAGTNLLQEFYNNSRLHYISNMANKFKSYVAKLQKDLDSTVMPGRIRLSQWLQSQGRSRTTLMPKHEKVVMHIDMDCFFVSVGIRNRPDLKEKPVAVTHSKGAPPRAPEGTGSDARNYEAEYYGKRHPKGNAEEGYNEDDEMVIYDSSDEESEKRVREPMRVEEYGSMSEVACSSYEAREFGVRNGTLLGEALKLCPQLQMIPYDFKGYEEVATILYDLVASYTLQMEAVSCDELYADCTDVLWETRATPMEFAEFLRQEVLQKTGCNCSIGIAENMLLARLATKQAKPNGQFYLKPEAVANFMSEQKIADLPGVGWALNLRIRTISSGISKCSELQKVPLKTLQSELGPKTGISLHNLCRGIDDRCVSSEKGRKSVSADVNYGIRFTKDDDAVSFVSELALEVRNRLRAVTAKGRTITLKVKVRKKDAPIETAKFMGHGVCDNMARSVTMKTATDDDQMIAKECHSLLQQMKVPVVDLRGVGIQVSRLEVKKLTDNQHDNSTLRKYLKPVQTETNQKPEADDDDFKETKTKDAKKEATALFPSNFEEVDATVLASLPEDIRLQVEEEFKQRAKTVPLVPPQVPSVPLPAQRNSEKSTELPASLSQIDPSVLGQLPKDIVDEITSMYASKTPSSPAKSSTKGPTAEQSPKRAPKKPNRAKRTPKKSSPDKMQVPYRHLTISQMFNKMGSPTKNMVTVDEDLSRDSPVQEVPETPQPSQSTTDKPNLMGRVELVDVRKLICEWVSEFDAPLVEDEEIFCRYVRKLVEERDLERAHVVIRHTCRQLLLKKKHDWLRFYSETVDQLQTAVFASYGSHLDLPSLTF